MPAALRAVRSRMPARALLLALFGALVVVLVTAPGAMADAITPESGGGSENAEAIDTLYKIALGLGFLIFLLVEGILLWTLIKHRFRRGGPPPAQIRGNTPLEVGWTIGAALLLVVLTVVTFFYLGDIKNPPASNDNGLVNAGAVQYATIDQPKPPGPADSYLTIDVQGQQYLWRYRYPNGSFSYYDMVVPYDTTVVLNITSSDVAHSWWIPKLGGKMDAVPPANKYVNKTWFKVTEEGNETYRGAGGEYTGASTFEGQCAELCGDNHADMRARVIALPVDEYRRWLGDQRRLLDESSSALARQREARGTRE
jgi:cytochrome c oxidase subunit II